MTITEIIREQIGELEGDVPKWMLDVLDLDKNATEEIASLKNDLDMSNTQLKDITERLKNAQSENIQKAQEEGQHATETETDESDKVLTVAEVLERGVEFD